MGRDLTEKERFIIKKSCLLFCEGADEKWFLIWYLNYLLLQNEENKVLENIQIVDFGGIKDLGNCLKTIQGLEAFDTVKGIAVIRDAETDAIGAGQSIMDRLSSCVTKHVIVSSNPYYLFPLKDNNNWKNGTLEDLCISIISNDVPNEMASSRLLSCCRDFLNNVQMERGSDFPRVHKNLIHSYFSSTDKFVDFKIGEAAKAGAFNWEDDKLNDLKDFLFTLARMGEGQ